MIERKIQKILLLGGTGAMGKYLAELLHKEGKDVFVTSRSYHNSAERLHYIKGNAHDVVFLKKIIEGNGGFDCIVDFMVYSTGEFSHRCDLLLSNTKQYIYISTARVYADAQGLISENSPRLLDITIDNTLLNSGDYCITKAKQENIIFNSKKNNWTIIRPYITYSNQRFELGVYPKEEWLYRAINGKKIVFSNDIASHITTLTYGLDVALAISKLIGNEKAIGEVFNVTTDRWIKWQEVLDIYLSALEEHGINADVVWTNRVYKFFSPLDQYQVKNDRYYDRIFNTEKISAIANVKVFKTPETQLKACLSEFLVNSKFGKINWMLQGFFDGITKDATPTDKEFGSFKSKIKYFIGKYTPFFMLKLRIEKLIFPLYVKIKKR